VRLDLLTEIYSSFEPFQPPSKEAYVALKQNTCKNLQDRPQSLATTRFEFQKTG
jgi:hypothetical protein